MNNRTLEAEINNFILMMVFVEGTQTFDIVISLIRGLGPFIIFTSCSIKVGPWHIRERFLNPRSV